MSALEEEALAPEEIGNGAPEPTHVVVFFDNFHTAPKGRRLAHAATTDRFDPDGVEYSRHQAVIGMHLDDGSRHTINECDV